MKKILSVLAFWLFAGAANATIVDFESIPAGNCAFVGSPISTQGFTFTDASGGGLFNCNAGVIHNGTSSALIAANITSSLTMMEEFGATFTLNGFEAGSRTSGDVATGITVTGTKADFSIIQELINFTALSFDNFSLLEDFSNLVSVNFLAFGNGLSPEFLIDNIIVNAELKSVPEPTILALLGLGLAGFGFSRKKNNSIPNILHKPRY